MHDATRRDATHTPYFLTVLQCDARKHAIQTPAELERMYTRVLIFELESSGIELGLTLQLLLLQPIPHSQRTIRTGSRERLLHLVKGDTIDCKDVT